MLTSGVKGIISAKPIHAQSGDERSKPTAADKLYIELGTKDKAETETLVRLGESGTVEPKFVSLENGYLAGKALGARSMCALLCTLIRKIREEKWDETITDELYFVFSVKREIARAQFAVETAAFGIAPDRAVVLDAAPCADFGGTAESAVSAKCGGGVVIAPADMKTIYNREMFADVVSYCEKNGIAFQYPTTAAGAGNEAGSIHKAMSGIRTLSLGIPTRNLHSGAEIINEGDWNAVLALAESCIR